jgi:hypothetical protein
MRENDQLDLLIDAALATYSKPPAGLEDRVLQAVAEAQLASPAISNQAVFPIRRILPWALGLAAAACVLLALIIHNFGTRPETQAHSNSSLQPQRTASRPGVIATSERHTSLAHKPKAQARRTAPGALVATLPKLDVFPTPQPLTPEEQALSVYAGRVPKPELEALARAQAQDEKPFPIATAHIPPIRQPDDDQN